MTLISPIRRFFLFIMIAGPMVFGGCSYIPWIGDNEDDLAFEEDFPFNDNQDKIGDREKRSTASDEDDFFAEDLRSSRDDDSSSDDSGFMDMDDGFASIDQRTDKKELEGDVGTLQTQM